mgnify:CR=1 FL=1
MVVDSNIVVYSLLKKQPNPFFSLLDSWIRDSVEIVVPSLLRFEVASVIWTNEKNGAIPSGGSETILKFLNQFPIRYSDAAADQIRAIEFARQFSLGKADDTHFLAVAERLDAHFWTADKRLFNAVSHHLDWVHLVSGDTEGDETA